MHAGADSKKQVWENRRPIPKFFGNEKLFRIVLILKLVLMIWRRWIRIWTQNLNLEWHLHEIANFQIWPCKCMCNFGFFLDGLSDAFLSLTWQKILWFLLVETWQKYLESDRQSMAHFNFHDFHVHKSCNWQLSLWPFSAARKDFELKIGLMGADSIGFRGLEAQVQERNKR